MRRWEELRPQLDERGVELVTICTDTPEKLREGKAKHGAKAVMLSDSDLAITKSYNLINPWNVTPMGGKPMPIPTTILVDKDGIVRWIDQAKDYQIRSAPDRVLAGIERGLA